MSIIALIAQKVIDRVESALYSYPSHTAWLAEKRSEILYGTSPRSEGRQAGRTSDTTASKGIRLADLTSTEKARWVKCISDLLEILPPMSRKLLECKYFRRLKVAEITKELYVSPAWYHVLQDLALRDVLLFATQRGLLTPIDE